MIRQSIFKIVAAIFFGVLININAQENYIVREIAFSGNDSLSADNLLEQMEFFETGWFADNLLFEDPFLFSQEIFQKDKIRIIRYYQREGFINANIDDVEFDIDNEDETIDINIFVNENKPVIVDTVNLVLGDSIDQSLVQQIKEDLSLKAGIRFRDQQIDEDKRTIINQFANRGYPYTKADYDLYLDTSKTTVGIDWNIELGKRAKFGEVIIEGNNRTDKEIIRDQVSFENGEWFESRELNKTQRQIYGLGIFYIVTVTPNLEEKLSNIPINIKIEELPRFNTKIGVGYGRDEKFRISLDQKWLGFLGGARQLQFYAKYSALTPYHVRLNFIQPNFVVQETKLSISPFVIRQTEPGFTINRVGTDLTLQRPLFFDTFGSLKYTFEQSRLDTSSVSQVDIEGYDVDELYNKSSIELGFERITALPLFNPEFGSFTSLAFHYSGLGLNSKYHFFRPSFDYRKYTSITDWLVFAFRIKMSTIYSFDDDNFVPFEERLYSGGSSSNRGWARAELGPKNSEGKPIGGKSLFEGNFEMRYPIYSIVSGVAFVDFGNVWKSQLTFKVSEFEYAAGLGIRVSTPIGPARLDVATPISQSPAKVQFFISVGHAF